MHEMNLQSWQMDVLKKLDGFKPGKPVVYSNGRHAGKSMMTQQAIDRLMRDLMNRPVEDLVLSEGRVLGARYHCVEPIGGNWLAMETWAVKTYGEVGSVWDITTAYSGEPPTWRERGRWFANDRKFWFRNERDRTLFILKWS